MGKVIDYGIPEHVRFAQAEKKKEKRYDLKVEFPFSSELKRMTTIYIDLKHDDHGEVFIKGAVRGLALRLSSPLSLRFHRLNVFWLPPPPTSPTLRRNLTPQPL